MRIAIRYKQYCLYFTQVVCQVLLQKLFIRTVTQLHQRAIVTSQSLGYYLIIETSKTK